jgi:hypothetical protein
MHSKFIAHQKNTVTPCAITLCKKFNAIAVPIF